MASASGGKLIQEMPYDAVVAAARKDHGDAKLGKNCSPVRAASFAIPLHPRKHPRAPLLAGIAQRYNRDELCESIMKPSAKIAQGFETQWFKMKGKD